MVNVADVDLTGWVRQISTPILDGNNPLSLREISALGTNIVDINDFTPSVAFADMVKYSREWITGSSSPFVFDTGESGLLDLDADGWPQTLPTDPDPEDYRLVRMFWALHDNFPAGRYVVTYDGVGTLDYRLGATLVSGAAGRDVIDVDGAGVDFEIDITATTEGNHLKNMRIVLLADEAVDTIANPFTTAFLNSLSIYSEIRHMDWERTNNSPQTVWANRSQVDDVTYTTDHGVPYEVQIQLCNALSANAWFCIPHQANDAFVNSLAALVLADLDSGLGVSVEYSNEVWNNQFAQATYVELQGTTLWVTGESDFTKRMNWYGLRTDEILGLWKTVWTASLSRVTGIMASQAANTFTISQAMDCPLKGGGDCTGNVDAIAIAPYFGGGIGSVANESTVELWDLDDLFTEITDNSIPEALTWMSDNKTVATTYSVDMVAYEGGQHLVGIGVVQDNTTITALFNSANRDPRMNASYDTYLDGWKLETDGTFNHWLHIGGYSKFGNWGSYEFIGQATTPKRQALEDF